MYGFYGEDGLSRAGYRHAAPLRLTAARQRYQAANHSSEYLWSQTCDDVIGGSRQAHSSPTPSSTALGLYTDLQRCPLVYKAARPASYLKCDLYFQKAALQQPAELRPTYVISVQ